VNYLKVFKGNFLSKALEIGVGHADNNVLFLFLTLGFDSLLSNVNWNVSGLQIFFYYNYVNKNKTLLSACPTPISSACDKSFPLKTLR
jgi:hypothetical protein